MAPSRAAPASHQAPARRRSPRAGAVRLARSAARPDSPESLSPLQFATRWVHRVRQAIPTDREMRFGWRATMCVAPLRTPTAIPLGLVRSRRRGPLPGVLEGRCRPDDSRPARRRRRGALGPAGRPARSSEDGDGASVRGSCYAVCACIAQPMRRASRRRVPWPPYRPPIWLSRRSGGMARDRPRHGSDRRGTHRSSPWSPGGSNRSQRMFAGF
jgi:hypothetical protein